MCNATRCNVGGTTVLFVDTSKVKEEGAARVIDHTRDLCVQVWVDDVEFEAVEGDRGGAKRGTTVGRGGGGGCGGADSSSTITILSSNGNPIAASSDLGPTGLDLRLTIFLFFKNQYLVSAGNS
jgi:hypothetical protein